jgi:hypothetical protein
MSAFGGKADIGRAAPSHFQRTNLTRYNAFLSLGEGNETALQSRWQTSQPASPVAKSKLREFIAGVIASRKKGDQQQ